MKPTCCSSCRRTGSLPTRHMRRRPPGGSSRSGCSFSQPRLSTITSPPKFGFMLMWRKVRIGIAASVRVDGDAAAVAVLEADDVVDVRVLRQQLVADAAQRDVEHAGHALHRRGDGQQVARADRRRPDCVPLEGVAVQRWQRSGFHGRHRQAVERARAGHLQQPLVHPAAGGNGARSAADAHAVTQHLVAFGQVDQRHLVRLRHAFAQHRAVGAARCPRAGRRRWRRSRRCRVRACRMVQRCVMPSSLHVDEQRVQRMAAGHEQPVAAWHRRNTGSRSARAGGCGRSRWPCGSKTRTPSSSAASNACAPVLPSRTTGCPSRRPRCRRARPGARRRPRGACSTTSPSAPTSQAQISRCGVARLSTRTAPTRRARRPGRSAPPGR